MRPGWILPAAVVVVLGPVMVRAPRPAPARSDGVATIADAVRACRTTGLTGWDLVDHATRLVHDVFSTYSAWHLWERPEVAFAHSRGYCNQYNLALAAVLRGLGFEVGAVHASRVRAGHSRPWWHNGHGWLRVTYEGRTLDVCASEASNRAGSVGFVPVSEIRPFTRLSELDTALAGVPFVAWTVWRAWLTGRDVPAWLYRPFDA